MRGIGVICECNPFHEGHRYLMQCAKQGQQDRVVVALMSGYFTQRGDIALSDPYIRATSMLQSADLILELPFPYSCAGAEFFASAGVDILSRLGVEELWFGSESGDIALLQSAADASLTTEYQAAYAKQAGGSERTAQAYFNCLKEFCSINMNLLPNDILGIAYLRAIASRKSNLIPVTVRRNGCGYADTEWNGEDFPSATALRVKILEIGLDKTLPFLLPDTAKVLSDAAKQGLAPADWKRGERGILALLRMREDDTWEQIAELSGGLGKHIADAAHKASSIEELFSLCATKKFTNARLRRGILFAATDVCQDDLRKPAAYVRLLAATPAGCEYLSEIRKTAQIRVVTGQSNLPKTPAAMHQRETEHRAHALYSLCLPRPCPTADFVRKKPTIIK